MQCYLFDNPTFLFLTPDVPSLLYYSHIPTAIIALLVGFFVFLKGPKLLANRLLFIIALLFASWTVYSLIGWTNTNGSLIAAIWPLFAVTKTLLAVLCVYLTYVFVHNGIDAPIWMKVSFLVLLLPVILLAHTNMSLSGFDITNCDAFLYEGLWFKYYYTSVSYLAIAWILGILVKGYLNTERADLRKQILLFGVGIEAFLLLFITLIFVATYYTNIGVLEDSRLEMYGLFGQAVFMATIGFLIVKFKAFNIRLVAANALVFLLLALVASQFTFAESVTSAILTGFTLTLAGFTSLLLLRSIQKERDQRVDLQHLAQDLAQANERLKELDKAKSEFVSIASHQLRSPLTSIRGYASMMLEGSFGQFPAKAEEALIRIDDSAKNMVLAVEDYLNVSRIESGNMQYDFIDFNFKDEAEAVAEDVRAAAMQQGLVLLFRSNLHGRGIVNADKGKTIQIIHNLINNAVKYTKKGTVTVFVRDDLDTNHIYMDVIDTGIGMSEKTLGSIFAKFARAEDASRTNAHGTGLGLFVARNMAEKMGGTITAESRGEGKGSTFTFKLPLQM